jgi:dipeptidyl aminopeptidase/acylaminoacyl peptidase
MKTRIQFRSKEQTIQGKFYSASGVSGLFPTILLLPGFPGNEDDVLGLGEELSQNGLNILTFNYRGTYHSEGEYSLKNTQEDIQAAFDFLQDELTVQKYKVDLDRLVLGGWSYGGGMGLIYAANHPEIKQIFSIAGTDHGEFAREYQRNKVFSNMIDEIFDKLKFPQGPVRFSGKPAIRELVQNPDRYDLLSQVSKLAGRDILLIGGWNDPNVVLEHHILPLFRALKREGADKVSIIAFQDGHAFKKNRSELAHAILSWIGI